MKKTLQTTTNTKTSKATKTSKFALIALILLGLLALTACGGDKGASQSSAAASESVAASESAATSESTASESTSTASEAQAGAFKTATPGVLTMGTNAAFPPYEYYEGDKIVGIDAEILEAVANKIGLELKIEDMEFGSILATLNTGKIDVGAAGMTVTDERKKSVDFSTSYAQGVQVVIVKEGSDIKAIEDLEGKKIGVQIATTGDIYASEQFGEGNVDKYDKGADAVLALNNDKVQAVIIDNEPAKNFVAANKGLQILETEYAVEDYAIAVSKENPELLKAIDKALAELKADGTLQAIVDKYIPAN